MNSVEEIEKYIFGQLSIEEKIEFESRMEKDPGLKQLVKEYVQTFDALKRSWVDESFKKFNRSRLIRQLSIAGIIVAAAIAALCFLAQKKDKADSDSSPVINKETVSTDSSKLDSSEIVSFYDSSFSDTSDVVNPVVPSIDINNIKIADVADVAEDTVVQETFFNPLTGVKWQDFELDNTKDNRIVLAGGTIIEINSGILTTASGASNLKKVKLRVKEFANYYDLWQEGLHTCSKDRQLITAGSCLIEAESVGEKVEVKEGETFTIKFPGNYDPDMTIFYGKKTEQEGFDWTEGEKLKMKEKPYEIKKDYTKKRGLMFHLFGIFGKSKTKLRLNDTVWFLEPVVMDEGQIDGKYTFGTLESTGSFKDVFNPLCSTSNINVKSMFFRKQNLLLRFHLDSTGMLDRFDYNFNLDRKAEKDLKKRANSILGNNKVDLKGYKFNERIVNVTLLPNFRVENRETLLSDSNLSKMKNFDSARSAYNAIVSSEFGYINCDRFAKYRNLINMDIHSQIGKLQDLRVFFKVENSVMRATVFGKEADLMNIPSNEEVLIIGISLDGKRMFILDTTTQKAVSSGLGEPFDALKVKEVLLKYR